MYHLVFIYTNSEDEIFTVIKEFDALIPLISYLLFQIHESITILSISINKHH